ncbi:hypothetical protein [Aeromonas caviae]|uniref:hypothetical protein n=1 Tax=Aeromonas caviae TaxID=648 RepID=UPI0021FBF626|nr:hypothetical protein KAM497c_19320 [Aeromonas caviae]
MILVLRLLSPRIGCWLLLALCAMRVQAVPVEAELLPGASERDWLLVIEADGLHRDEDLNLQPLLRQFAVGRVSIQRVSAQSRSLTRWQIPLHLLDTSPRQVPSLPLGADLTPSLAVPTRSLDDTLMPTQDPVFSPVELQARVLHEGNLYPGQPFIYELTLWLPANLEAPNLGEPITPAFTIRRLGEDRWDSPASPGLPGRLTRKWLLQAKGPGLHPVESPRFQGRLPPQDAAGATAPGNAGDLLSVRAATLFIKVDKAPLEPVASSLVLRQQFSPAQARVGEPVIRTLTLVMEGGMATASPLAGPAPARRPLHEAGRRAATGAIRGRGGASLRAPVAPGPDRRRGRALCAAPPDPALVQHPERPHRGGAPARTFSGVHGKGERHSRLPRTRGPVSLLGAPGHPAAGIHAPLAALARLLSPATGPRHGLS